MPMGNRYKCNFCDSTFTDTIATECPVCRRTDIKIIETNVRID